MKLSRIPAIWQREIDAGTAFGARAAAAVESAAKRSRPARPCRDKTTRRREAVGTALKNRIERLIEIKAGQTCGCTNLATQMDTWGIAGCEKRRAEIVAHLVSNRAILVEALRAADNWIAKAAGVVAEFVPDAVLRAGAEWLLDGAIEEVRVPIVAHRVQRGRHRRPYTGWRSEADGPRIEHGPFVSGIRHLTYFVYGRSLDSWQWNLRQLAERWHLFNGTRILGIAYDHQSATPDQVIEYATSLAMTFDHVLTAPNNPDLREVVLFEKMVEILRPESASESEVVFSGHAKGQKYDDASHTRDWTDLMYRSCLDDWPAVNEALRTTLFAGSFREYGLLGKNWNWAYSGTFYWWRLREIGKRKWRDVDRWFAGTESWPSKMCDPRETACLFLNDSRRLYDSHYWTQVVWPAWEKYRAERKI